MFCWYERLDDFADYVVAVYPHSGSGDSDYYSDREMDLKSIRIAGKAVESMRLEKHERLREAYHYFHRISVGPNLAGWVFKAIIHRMFSGGWSDGSAPQPIRMVSNNSDPPVFSADLPSVPDAWLPSPAPLSTDTRAVTLVNFTHGLNDVTLDKNNYYIPIATTNPLFDSFTIDRHRDTVIISIFQITISQKHEGSAAGYFLIRKIIAHVRRLLKVPKAPVKIVYILVCPKDATQHKWQMPVDWNKNIKINDHRGNAFYLRVPT